MTLAFDTLKFVETLEQAHIPREQARAIVGVMRDAHDGTDVASKTDLRELESTTESNFDLLRKDILAGDQRLDAKIDGLEQRLQTQIGLLRWMTGVILAGVGTILVKLLWG